MTTSALGTAVTLLSMTTLVTSQLEVCTMTGTCSCRSTSGIVIDLSPLANGSIPRFRDVPDHVDDSGYKYSWNPCRPFDEGDGCSQVAMCRVSPKPGDNSTVSLGSQGSAAMASFKDGSLAVISYHDDSPHGSRSSIVMLYCHPEEEGELTYLGNEVESIYFLQLKSRYACPKHQ